MIPKRPTIRGTIGSAAVSALCLMAGAANAAICEYRPSQLIGSAGTGATIAGGTTVAATGTAVKLAGYYTLVHATLGATMLGSTAAGASAAGTAGIIAGTGGGIGAVVATITAPATLIAAAVAAVGTGTFEGVCYFTDERITEFDDVVKHLKPLADLNPDDVRMFFSSAGNEYATILLTTPEGKVSYDIEDLYIVNGVLMHRDWGRNTTVGRIAFIVQPNEAEGLN